jgi:hypothetical protein
MTATPERCDDATRSPRGVLRCILAAGHEGMHHIDPAGPAEQPKPDPDPQPVPGSVAIATVRIAGSNANDLDSADHAGVLVVRTQHGRWYAPILDAVFTDAEVTVTSRAVVVTEADREDLIEKLRQYWHLDPSASTSVEVSVIREWFAARLEGGA